MVRASNPNLYWMKVKGPFAGSTSRYEALLWEYLERNPGAMRVPNAPETTVELDSLALLEAAAQAGTAVSERMLENFRYKGLMPRPRRVGQRGRTPVWAYPAGAEAQLVRLLWWRGRTKDTGVLKVLLWLDGFAIPTGDVRTALLSYLRHMNDSIEQVISTRAEELGLDPADPAGRTAAVEELARTMAAKRGAVSIPRTSRLSAADRSRALALLVRTIGLGERVDGTPAEGDAVERVLGIAPNGRRYSPDGVGPWLTGPTEEIFGAAAVVGLPNMLKTLDDVTDDALGRARQTVNALFRLLPLAARMMDVLAGQDNVSGLAGMEKLAENPDNAMWLLAAVTAMLAAGWSENLATVTDALQQFPDLAERAQSLPDLPRDVLEARLADKPAQVRNQVERIVNAVIDGKLDAD